LGEDVDAAQERELDVEQGHDGLLRRVAAGMGSRPQQVVEGLNARLLKVVTGTPTSSLPWAGGAHRVVLSRRHPIRDDGNAALTS